MYELTNTQTGEKTLVKLHTASENAAFADASLTGQEWELASKVSFANPNQDGAFADGQTLDVTGVYTIKLLSEEAETAVTEEVAPEVVEETAPEVTETPTE